MTAVLFFATVCLGTLLPLGIKWLLMKHLLFEEILFWCSLFVVAFCVLFRPRSVFPGAPIFSRVSAFRVIVGGGALALSTFAHDGLSATEANMIARLDLAIFIFLFGTSNKRYLALVAIAVGVTYSILPIQAGHSEAVFAIWASTVLTAVGYWFTRKAAESRDPIELILPPYVGAALFSVLLLGRIPVFPTELATGLLLVTACALGLCFLCAELFRRARLGAAELTGCLALLCTYLVEGHIIGISPPAVAGFSALVSAGLGFGLVYWEEFPKWVKIKVLKA